MNLKKTVKKELPKGISFVDEIKIIVTASVAYRKINDEKHET